MSSSKSVSIVYLLCGIVAAALSEVLCVLREPEKSGKVNGSLPTIFCGKEYIVMENKNDSGKREGGVNATANVFNSTEDGAKNAAKKEETKREQDGTATSGTKIDKKADQNPGTTVTIVSKPSTRPRRSVCNGRKKCKRKRSRSKKSKKQRSRRRRRAKAPKNRRR